MNIEDPNHILTHQDTAGLLQRAASEAVVNGIWFHLLSEYFPYPHYIIAPEYHSTVNERACRFDLAVVDVQKQEVVFIYEGKKANLTAGQTRELLNQTFKYIRGNKPALAMYGTGNKVAFFGNVGSQHMWRLTNSDDLTRMDDRTLEVFYTVGSDRDTENISKFLHRIKAKVDTT